MTADSPATLSRRQLFGAAAAVAAASVAPGAVVGATAPSAGAGDRRLVRGGFLYAGDAAGTVIPNSRLLIDGDRIAAIGHDDHTALPEADETIDARGMMVLPGFVNPHWHECLVEGPDPSLPDDSDLVRLPFADGGDIEALGRYFSAVVDVQDQLTPDEAVAIARWSLWLHLRSGTTLIGDTGSLNTADAMAQAALDLGMRIRVSRWGSDIVIPNGAREFERYADPEDQARDWETLMTRWNDHPSGLVRGMPSVLAAFSSSDEQLSLLRAVATQFDSGYAAHLAPLANEAAALEAVFGSSAIGRFGEHGLLTDRLLAVHTAFVTGNEYRQIVDAQVRVTHSPANYGYLGESTISETGMIGRMIRDGLPVSCSTDGNYSFTGGMPEAMRFTMLAHNEAHNDNTLVPPLTALATGTRHAAMGLGWDDQVGSLEAGKQADLVLVPIDDFRYSFDRHPLRTFLFAGSSKDVDTVIVGGKTLIEGGHSTNMDEEAMLRDCRAAVARAGKRIFGK